MVVAAVLLLLLLLLLLCHDLDCAPPGLAVLALLNKVLVGLCPAAHSGGFLVVSVMPVAVECIWV
jgi:hypothetical protein